MKAIFFFLIFSIINSAQTISNTRLETIVKLLVSNSPEISKYVSSDEFEISNRFGISYEGIDNKFFIANEFPKIDRSIKYNYKIESVDDDDYSLLTISISAKNTSKEYYLKDSSIISKPFFYSRDWKTKESEHFKFFISDEKLFNHYSINQLE
ncbi:MAG TPA: hypothetical protein PK665_08635, partial [Ignavibacteriaceae bacterium]|nr:hypothetical protein [Ignavibacteriaceae bacterium]